MSHLDLSSNDDDGYYSDGSHLTDDLNPEAAVQIQGKAKYFLSHIPTDEDRLNDTWERDQRELKSALQLEESQSALHLCDLDNPHNILDIGCGTGEWTIGIAEEYPSAKVIGLDINDELLPRSVPTNLTFQLGDHHTQLLDKHNHFDLIHIAHLDGCVRDWDALFRDVYRILRPGGYVECREQSITAQDGKCGKKRNVAFIEELLTESEKRGMPLNVAQWLEHHLRQTGFAIRHVIARKIKFGDHEGLERRRFKAFADGLLGGPSDELALKAALAADRLKKDDYMTLCWVSAQKPIPGFTPKVTEGYYHSTASNKSKTTGALTATMTMDDAYRPKNLSSVDHKPEAKHLQYRSSDVLQMWQGSSKRSYQEYDQDRISMSVPSSIKRQPLYRPVLEGVHSDRHMIRNSSENPEPSSKYRRILPPTSLSVSTSESMSRTSSALHNERLSGPPSPKSAATRVDSCGQIFTMA